MKIFRYLIAMIIFASLSVKGQVKITLNEAIKLAMDSSMRSEQNRLIFKSNTIQNNIFMNSYRPTLLFNSSLPNLNNSSYAVRQPDGSINYRLVSQNNSLLGLGFIKPLTTGGTISINSDLSRFDDFKSNFFQYSSTPLYIKFSQPLLTKFSYRLEKKINRKNVELSDLQFRISQSNLANIVINSYFDLLEDELNQSYNKVYVNESKRNLEIEESRIKLGTTSDDRLYQLRIQYLNNVNNLKLANERVSISKNSLFNYIGAKGYELVLEVPFPSKDSIFNVLPNLKYISNIAELELKALNAEKNLNSVKQISSSNLTASFGVVNVSNDIQKAYSNVKTQQVIALNLTIPIYDWGKRKSSIALATNEIEVLRKQKEIFLQDLSTDEKNARLKLLNLNQRLETAIELRDLGEKRYKLSQQLYRAGKLQIFELNNAQSVKDSSTKNLLSLLRDFWVTRNMFY